MGLGDLKNQRFHYEILIDCLNKDLYNILEWLKSNKLSLNIKKQTLHVIS